MTLNLVKRNQAARGGYQKANVDARTKKLGVNADEINCKFHLPAIKNDPSIPELECKRIAPRTRQDQNKI
jgi:hypothetical protein